MLETEGESTPRFTATDSLMQAVNRVAAALTEAGFEDPRGQARRLVATAAQIGAVRLIATPAAPLGSEAASRLEEILLRRLSHEPVTRILGRREFYGRDFDLSPATLDPRPDTEVLIEAASELILEEGWSERPLRLLDIGTGTGAIAITMLAEFTQATCVATDISVEALATARANAQRLGVSGRMEFLEARSLDGIEGPFDLILSNPPYIPSADIESLDPEVRLYDPLAALDGGPDGLQIYREIISGLGEVMPAGWVVFEVGYDQAGDVAQLLAAEGAKDLRTWQDLGNHTRCVAGRTQN
jgi:release factor glutamine methyltransferase